MDIMYLKTTNNFVDFEIWIPFDAKAQFCYSLRFRWGVRNNSFDNETIRVLVSNNFSIIVDFINIKQL